MDAVSEVKSRLNIEDVVSEYISLKRTGKNYKGLSPFTNEKTPSLIVSPEKQIWKDFSSGKGGSVIDFIMEVEGLEFKEALEFLARKAGVELEQFSPKNRSSSLNKERLYQLLDASTKFYQVQLKGSTAALNYVKKRGFTKQTILQWRLGYSPNNGNALVSYLKKQGFSEKEIKQSGLSSSTYRENQDMFRGRLMIPLADPQGLVIGFTARVLGDAKNAPKYINTPQTPLYDKSHHVFGFHLAKDAIRKDNFAVITEGNLDVITSHQAGVKEVVATAGTALTLQQLKLLGRLTTDIRLAFDSDRAGLAATERVIPIAVKAKVNLSVIELPEGLDPDQLINSDPKAWRVAIDKSLYAVDWLMKRYKATLDITSASGKKKYSDAILPILRSLEDPVEIDHFINKISKEIDVSREALKEKLDQGSLAKSVRKKQIKSTSPAIDKNLGEYIKLQDKFLCLVLARPTLRELLADKLSRQIMPSENGKNLYQLLKDNPETPVNKLKIVKNMADYVKIEVLLYEELYQGIELNSLYEEALRLRAELVTKYVKQEKEKISQGMKEATKDVDIRTLQEKDKQYNQLLRQVKGEVNA